MPSDIIQAGNRTFPTGLPAMGSFFVPKGETTMPATGPTSELGKAKMRENPLKHGLTAKHIVIPGESAEEYTALRVDLFESYQPVTAGEEVLTNQIVEGYWRLMRARKVEADFWKKTMETPGTGKAQPDPEGYPVRRPPSDFDESLGRAFRKHADEHTRMHRYVTAIERNYYKAIGELQKEQDRRQERYDAQQSVSQNPEHPSATQSAPAILASSSSVLASGQSVSQNPETLAPRPSLPAPKAPTAAGHPSVPAALRGGQYR